MNTANNYTFTASTGASLASMTGSTQMLGAGNDDIAPGAVANIGFTFLFEGMSYTQFSMSSNGIIALGSTLVQTGFSNIATASSGATLPKIMPMWDDISTGTSGYINYLTTGSSPYRELRIEFYGRMDATETSPSDSKFQVIFYETTNKIEFIYGSGSNPSSATIGIGGATAANYLARNHATNNTCASTGAVDVATWPGSGTKYTFEPDQNTLWFLSSTSWTPPAGVCTTTIECWGGGGAGGVSDVLKGAGGGGGGGAYAKKNNVSVSSANSYPLVVGAGGIASSTTGASGGNGENSTFNSNEVIAVGGSGGGYYKFSTSAVVSGGSGGQATSCTPSSGAYSGGNGANPPSTNTNSTVSGGSGASAGTGTNGNNASGSIGGTAVAGGAAGVDGYSGGLAAGGIGTKGLVPGGGGSGSRNSGTVGRIAGDGGSGMIKISWTTPSPSSAPVINSPICTLATSVSGSSSEADGTSIEVFNGATSLGTTSVTTGVWTISGLSALSFGASITAKASASCKTTSASSAAVTVSSCSPTIITQGTLSTYTACSNTASSSQTFTVSGSSLTADISITAPSGFEVSTNNSTWYTGSSMPALVQSNGTVNATTIYVRMASLSTSPASGNITSASTGATTQTVGVSGTVNNVPVCASTPSPSNAASDQSASGITLSWASVAGATGYDVYLQSGTNPPLTKVSSNQAGASYSTGSLTSSTTYYWYVVPKNSCGDATGCSVWSFVTAACDGIGISATGDGGFENGSTFASNGWTAVNAAKNVWELGTAAAQYAGSRGAYIAEPSGTYAYTISTSYTSHLYKDITIPSGVTGVSLSFYWKGNGESGYDRLLVYTAPTSVTPVANSPLSSSTTLTGATLRWTQTNYTQTSYTLATISSLDALAGTTVRFIFTWQNDNTLGSSPGAAIDNISLNYTCPCTTPLSGTVNVGSGQTYTTLTGTGGLFEKINNCGLSANLTANIISDITETGSVALNQWNEIGGSNYTLTIQPDGTTVRTISATAVAAGSPMINFNGADRVTINGNNKYLLFRNTNATSANTGATIQFDNGSINCTLTNCDIENNCSSSSIGNIVIGTSGTNTILISNNNLHGSTSGGITYSTIYSDNINNSVTITNNNIYNFSYEGIYLINCANNLSITGNNIFQENVSSATWTCCIHISAGSGHQINNNYIGGSQVNCGGSAWSNSVETTFRGIYLSTGTSDSHILSGNTIKNVSLTNTGSPYFYGIYASIGLTLASSIQGNNIQNITCTSATTAPRFYGIFLSEGKANIGTVSGNLIGDASSLNSIQFSGNSSSRMVGIFSNSSASSNTFSNNTIANLTYTGSSSPLIVGILNNLGDLKKNNIYNLGGSNVSATPIIRGLDLEASFSGSNEFSNNMIALNGGNSTNPTIQGIFDYTNTSYTSNYFHNSINISGGATTSNSTYGYYKVIGNSINMKNNVFSNSRSIGNSIKHYALYFGVTTGTNYSDYNNLFSTSGYIGYYSTDKTTLTSWQNLFNNNDANSKTFSPDFTSSTNLHLTSAADGNNNYVGTPITAVGTDIDGDTRSTTFPYIGADERSVPLPVELTDFTAACQNQQVKLNWTTQSELNNDYFGIERSKDGILFNEIGRVAGHGNSNVENHYQYFDEQALAGTSYYRLNQVDFNGDSKIYLLKAVGCDDKQHEIVIYPNPNSGDFEISGLSEGNCIDVFDVLGKKVISTLSKSTKEKLQFAGIKPGVYFVVIKNASGITNTQKLVIEQ